MFSRVLKSILLDTGYILLKNSLKKYAYNILKSLKISVDILRLKFYICVIKNKGSDNMSIYGYHRTSTTDQHLDRGIKEITDYCISNNLKLEKIYTDQQTGKNFNRPRYTIMKEDVLRSGDILLISELDRLGRNKQDTLKELRYFKDNNIRVMILEIPTTTQDLSKLENNMAKMIMDTINNMLIELYATMAQAEIEKKEKRQQEGIQAKKDRGEWNDYGRPKVMEYEQFKREYYKVLCNEKRPFELIHDLGLTKPTYYRYKKQYETKEGKKNE